MAELTDFDVVWGVLFRLHPCAGVVRTGGKTFIYFRPAPNAAEVHVHFDENGRFFGVATEQVAPGRTSRQMVFAAIASETA